MYVIRKKEYSKYCLEYDEIIEEKIECCESTDQNDEYCEIIEDGIIKHQKVKNINMLKSSRNESNKIKELGLTMKELKAIARKRGVKNYENLSRIRLVEETDKLEPPKEFKKKKLLVVYYLEGKKYWI